MKYWLCEIGSKALLSCVESDEDLNGKILAAGGASNEQRYFAVPEGLVAANCKLEETDGVYALVEDTSKRDNPLWKKLRSDRDQKLVVCDWTQLTDAPLTSEEKSAWATYRQALRDVPQNTIDPEAVTWPAIP